jgi:hypothetical protein
MRPDEGRMIQTGECQSEEKKETAACTHEGCRLEESGMYNLREYWKSHKLFLGYCEHQADDQSASETCSKVVEEYGRIRC